MLGSQKLQDFIKTSDGILMQPNVRLEINQNTISAPYLYGTGNAPTINSISQTFSSVGSAPEPQNVNRGISTSVFSDTTCQSMISKANGTVASITKISVVNGVATLTSNAAHSINSGDQISASDFANQELNGVFIALANTGNNIIKYNTGSPTLNIAERELRKRGHVEYSINEYVSEKITSSPVKFFMKLKSDYEYQKLNSGSSVDYTFAEEFIVNVKVIGKKSGKYVYTQTSNKNVTVNSSRWQDFEIGFANPDDTYDSVYIFLSFESNPNQRAALLVDQFVCVEVSDYEIYASNRLPLSTVFESFRPGEVLVDYPDQIPNIKTTIDANFPQQCTPVHMSSQYALGQPLEIVQRSITPFAGNPCNYYLSGSIASSKKAWAIYDNSFKTNKIVIKVNAIAYKPSSFIIKLLINGSWTTIDKTGGFDDHGILRLYKNGNTWSTSQWNVTPTLSESSGDITEYIEIQGIYFECSGIEYTYPNSPLSQEPSIKLLELIEISARLEVDMSPFVLDLTIDKELSEDSTVPLPVGQISSSMAVVSFSNIPIILGRSDILTSNKQDDVVPMSNFSRNSPFANLLVKGAKIICQFKLKNDGYDETIPAFHMYVDKWIDSIGSPDFKITAECFDTIQRLHSTKVRPLYFRNATINEIIFAILDSVGFSEYSFKDLNSLNILQGFEYNPDEIEYNKSQKTIAHYWTDKDASVTETLNELFKIYQISMYVNEYGIVNFISLNSINQKLRYMIDQEADFPLFQDFTSDTNKSNIVSLNFEVQDPIKDIVLNYKKPRPTLSEAFVDEEKDRNKIMVKKAREIIWEPNQGTDVIPFFELAPPGIISRSQNKIKYDPIAASGSITRTIKNSGYLLIDQEIVKYDGLEYEFTTSGDPDFSYLDVIRNETDINLVINKLIVEYGFNNVSYKQNGYLCNVERGMFGTTADRHIVEYPGRTTGWFAREFNESFSSVATIDEADGKFTSDVGKLKINCTKSSGGIFFYPPENNQVGRKRKFALNYYISEVPTNKEGALGAAIGVTIENNKITNGLFIFTGLSPKKKKTEVDLIVKQVYTEGGTTKIDTLTSNKKLDFSDTEIISQKQPLELYVEFNEEMNAAKMFIGTNSIFQAKKSVPDGPDKDKKKDKVFKPVEVKLKPINKSGLFGFVASGSITGYIDALAFTVKLNPRDFNDIQINDLDSDYEGNNDGKIGRGYYIGADNFLTQLVQGQFVEETNKFKDAFVWNGSPVARGINFYDIDYQLYPVIETPRIIFNGYTYETAVAAASYFYEGIGLPGADE